MTGQYARCIRCFVVAAVYKFPHGLCRSVHPIERSVNLLCLNRLTPNDPYMGRTAPLTSKCCILYIYSTNTGTEYFKHALYSPFFFSSKCSLFHNANLFGFRIIHILYTACAKIKKKNNSGAKELREGTLCLNITPRTLIVCNSADVHLVTFNASTALKIYTKFLAFCCRLSQNASWT